MTLGDIINNVKKNDRYFSKLSGEETSIYVRGESI